MELFTNVYNIVMERLATVVFMARPNGNRDSIHHHLQEAIFETATVPESRRKLLYSTPSGWWWCTESVFRSK